MANVGWLWWDPFFAYKVRGNLKDHLRQALSADLVLESSRGMASQFIDHMSGDFKYFRSFYPQDLGRKPETRRGKHLHLIRPLIRPCI